MVSHSDNKKMIYLLGGYPNKQLKSVMTIIISRQMSLTWVYKYRTALYHTFYASTSNSQIEKEKRKQKKRKEKKRKESNERQNCGQLEFMQHRSSKSDHTDSQISASAWTKQDERS